MRRPLVRLSFAARLGTATSLLIVIVCVTESWVLARRDLENVRRYLIDRGRNASLTLARDASASLAPGNVEVLRQVAQQVHAQSGLRYARIFDRHGLLLVSVGGPPGQTFAPTPEAGSQADGPLAVGEGTWEFQAPVWSAEGLPTGTVAVGIPLDALEEIRRGTLATTTAFTTLFSLAAILGALVLARAVTRPLGAVATAADAIARGDLAARVAVRSQDEIGALARSFNSMAESLTRSRAALEEKVAELEEASRLKSEFVATVSHELRTPLNVIIGYAEMLAAGDGGPVTTEQAEMIGAIQRYSQAQLELITSVLDFSRLSSGHFSFHVERFTLAPLITEVQALYGGRLRTARVRLSAFTDPRVPELVTDRIKLQEIVRNLVDNAVKFTEDGVISLAAYPGGEPDWVRIEITDTGSGIGDSDLASIFDAFHQIGESSTRRTGGVGLGLSIVKQLTEALGGRVSVASQLGGGSTFRVDLPCMLPGISEDPRAPVATAALDQVARNAATLPGQGGPLGATMGARRPPR